MQVFYSNRVETLYERLKGDLFDDFSPFRRRLIMVPSAPLQAWLMLQMARDPTLGIAAGMEMGYPEKIFQKIQSYSSSKKEAAIPQPLELALAIEAEIRRMLQKTDGFVQPLRDYLGPEGAKAQRRLSSLAEKLAGLFKQYGEYGGELAAGWEIHPGQEWQCVLWSRVFGAKSPWTYPYREFGHPPVLQPVPNLSIHVFAISFLPRIQFRYLQQLAEQVPVHQYVLSPCEAFWSDTLSPRESRRLHQFWKKRKTSENQLQELERYLKDCNPLLANFGRLGREMAFQIEESQALTDESYQPSAASSLLAYLQTDMLRLRNPALSIKTEIGSDSSIQVHSAPTPFREVQVLHDLLLGLIDSQNSTGHPLLPQDIIVMAPNILEYEPFIKGIFRPEKGLPAQIANHRQPAQSPLVQGFLHLLSLSQGRWEAVSMVNLLQSLPFQRKWGFSKGDIETFCMWIDKCGIRWGLDAQHREELLKKGGALPEEVAGTGTWQFGIERLLAGLVSDDPEQEVLPFGEIKASESELLGRLIHLLKSLRRDLRRLYDGSAYNLCDWSDYFKNLLATYFYLSDDDEENFLKQHFEDYARIARRLKGASFSFTSLYRHLLNALSQVTPNYKESQLHAVRFCSLLPMHTLPARVVVLLGMQDGAFPRQETNFTFNLMKGDPRADYCPSSPDFDRFVFLEALLSAREHFILSFQNRSIDDYKEVGPSLLITELLNYLDKGYRIQGTPPSSRLCRSHPLNAFDKSYFTPRAPFPSFSEDQYAAACAYYRQEKRPPHRFLPAFTIGAAPMHPGPVTVDLRDLAAFAKDPVKSYFNKSLGMYLQKPEDRQIDNQDPFFHNPLELYRLETLLHSKSIHQAVDYAERMGWMPTGPFKHVACGRMQKKLEERHSQYEKLELNLSQREILLFSNQHREVLKTADGWRMPPLEIEFEGRIVRIQGVLEDVFPQGILFHTKREVSGILKIWPQYLVFQALIASYRLPFKPLLLISGKKGERAYEPFHSDPIIPLKQFLAYYFAGMRYGTPLMPDWVPHFLKEPPSQLTETLFGTLANDDYSFPSEYLQWHARGMALPDMEGWKKQAQDLYSPMICQWFPRTAKNMKDSDV